MKIQVNGTEIFEIKEWEKKLLCNDILEEKLEEEIIRRLRWVISHKVDQCYKRFFEEWIEKLRLDPEIKSIPLDKEDFINMVTSNRTYQTRSARENCKHY